MNVLHAGRAIRDYESFSKAELVVIQAPDDAIPEIVDELAASGLYWPGKAVALFHATLDSSALWPLGRRGASTGSIAPLLETPPNFLIEGQPAAMVLLRRLLKHGRAAATEIDFGKKNEYIGGVQAATADFIGLLDAAVERFRRAGMQKAAADSTAASLIEGSMRAYFRSGKRLVDRARPRS